MIIYKWFAKAQARYPKQVGKLMRLATSSVPKGTSRKTATHETTSSVTPPTPPAPKPQRDPNRTSGILAANYAARIPGAE